MRSESVLTKCDLYSQSFHEFEPQKASTLTPTYSHLSHVLEWFQGTAHSRALSEADRAGTHHADSSLAVEGDERGVVHVFVRYAGSAALEVQVDFIRHRVEYRRACDSTDVLEQRKQPCFRTIPRLAG